MNIKKIIAREGLILVLFILATVITVVLMQSLAGFFVPQLDLDSRGWSALPALLILVAYPFYVLIRFIFWGIRKMKGNDE